MFTTTNWYEKSIDDIYDFDSELSDQESFLFLYYLLNNYPNLEIEWIEFLEEIIDYQFEHGNVYEVLNFVNIYREKFPDQYEWQYGFIEKDLIPHLLYLGDINTVKERLEIIKNNPDDGLDTVTIDALYHLIFHGYYDLALDYSKSVWKPLFDSDEVIDYSHVEFCATIYQNELEELYQKILNGEQFDIDSFIKTMATYEVDDIKTVFKTVFQNLKDPLDKIDIEAKIENGNDDLLLTLNIQFLKYMKEKFGMPFMHSDRLWSLMQAIELFGSAIQINGFFYIPYPILSKYINYWYEESFYSNEVEMFGKIFGLRFAYKFLYDNELISDLYYRQMEENISLLQYEFMVHCQDKLWQMKFIYKWPQINTAWSSMEKLFSETYNYNIDDSVFENLNNYFETYMLPDRIQQEIDTYKDQEIDEVQDLDYDDRWQPTEPYINIEPKIGRNEPCPCGSGKKYKKCCLEN